MKAAGWTQASQPQAPPITVGGAYPVTGSSESKVLALAAAVPFLSDDPVDIALEEAAHQWEIGNEGVHVLPEDVDPATKTRRYSLTMVRDYYDKDGGTRDLVVMRGSLGAVMANSTIKRKDKALAKRNAAWAERRGWRALAVAAARVREGDEVGEFKFQGFAYVGLGKPQPLHDAGPADWARVNVWSVSLRLQHWLNVAVVFILSCTGYLIMDPFFGPEARQGAPTGFLMGWIRMIHFTVAFVWVIVGATRIVSAIVSRDRHLRWTEFWPIHNRQDLKYLGQVVAHYALIKKESPLFVAHNPLQQLTYTFLYVACAVQMLTGFALFGLYHQSNPFWAFISTPVHWFGVPGVRLFHTMVMFGLWAFVIAHVYLAARADSLERHGGISSMINGGVWLRRGAKPVDGPEVG